MANSETVMEIPKQVSSTDLNALPRKVAMWLFEEVRWFFRVVISAADRFYWDNGFSRASALAYSSLLSIVPVMVLAFGLLTSFIDPQRYLSDVQEFIFYQFVPPETVDLILEQIKDWSNRLRDLHALVIGFVVICTLLLINTIEYTLNEIWQVFESRTIAHRLAIFCSIIVIGPVLAFSAYYFTKWRLDPFIYGLGSVGPLQKSYEELVPFFIDFLAFWSLYYLVPKAPVRWRSAVFGAFLAALLFAAAKAGFANYISNFASYDKVYGTVGAIPVFLLWLYLLWIVVLFGAECSYQAQYLPRTGRVWKRSILSVGDGSLVMAVQSLLLVAKAFREGENMPAELEIAERLGCSSAVLKPTLDTLVKAGYLSRGDSRDQPLTLLCSADKIRLKQVRESLYKSRESMHFAPELACLFGSIGKDIESITLADLLAAGERS